MSTSELESFKQRARSNLYAVPRILGAIMGASGSTANVSLAQERQRCAQTNPCAACRRLGYYGWGHLLVWSCGTTRYGYVAVYRREGRGREGSKEAQAERLCDGYR